MNGHAEAAAADKVWSSERASPRQSKTVRAPQELAPEESAATRDRLVGEIARIGSPDEAASWAREGIKAKNGLTAPDAKVVEEAFAARLSELQSHSAGIATTAEAASGSESAAKPHASVQPEDQAPIGIDKSGLAIAEPRRHRNKEHLRFVAKQPCLVCGRSIPIPTTSASCSHEPWAGR